jgi:hypothetical protein
MDDSKVTGGNVWDPYSVEKESPKSTKISFSIHHKILIVTIFAGIVTAITKMVIFLVETSNIDNLYHTKGNTLSFTPSKIATSDYYMTYALYILFLVGLFCIPDLVKKVQSRANSSNDYYAPVASFVAAIMILSILILAFAPIMSEASKNTSMNSGHTLQEQKWLTEKLGSGYGEVTTNEESEIRTFIGEDKNIYEMTKKVKGEKTTLILEKTE